MIELVTNKLLVTNSIMEKKIEANCSLEGCPITLLDNLESKLSIHTKADTQKFSGLGGLRIFTKIVKRLFSRFSVNALIISGFGYPNILGGC